MHGVPTKRAIVLLATALAATQTVSAAHAATATATPATAALRVTVTCGEIITTSITVANDLACSGDALRVAADNVTLNLGGHTITGDGTGTGVFISPIGSEDLQNADTVEHGTVTGFATGVGVATTQNTTVSRLTLTGDGSAFATRLNDPAAGLSIADSSILNCGFVLRASLELGGLAVTHTKITGGGVFLSQVTGPIRFDSDQLTHTPVTLDDQGFVTVTNSKLTDSPVISQYFFGYDVFENDTFTGAGTALTLFDELNETVTGNTFTGNDIGLKVQDDADNLGGNVVSGNTFTKNSTAGVLVNIPGTGASIVLSGNIAKRNGTAPDGATDDGGNPVQGGLHVYLPDGQATVSDNQTTRNSGFGIWALGDSISGAGNLSVHDQFQCSPLTLCSY